MPIDCTILYSYKFCVYSEYLFLAYFECDCYNILNVIPVINVCKETRVPHFYFGWKTSLIWANSFDSLTFPL